MSRCTTPNCGVRAAVPSFTLRQPHADHKMELPLYALYPYPSLHRRWNAQRSLTLLYLLLRGLQPSVVFSPFPSASPRWIRPWSTSPGTETLLPLCTSKGRDLMSLGGGQTPAFKIYVPRHLVHTRKITLRKKQSGSENSYTFPS